MDHKPQLHASMINTLYACGEQFRRRYGARFGWADREEKIPPGIALVTGIATHHSIEKNLIHKIETGELLPLEAIQDLTRDQVLALWDNVMMTEEEASNPDQTQGSTIDTSIALAKLHASELAPDLLPKSVERKWVIALNGYPYDLAGQWDIEETTGSIRDTKTAAKTPTQESADNSEQLSMYALAKTVCDGSEPSALFLDTLVKTKTPKLVILETQRTQVHRQALLHRIERATEIIERGAFTPANPQDWHCSLRWCGYAATCKFFSGKK